MLFGHRSCPCTRATLRELEQILAHCPESVHVQIVLVAPAAADSDRVGGNIETLARSLSGVEVVVDPDGVEARRFAVRTSGHVIYGWMGVCCLAAASLDTRGHEGKVWAGSPCWLACAARWWSRGLLLFMVVFSSMKMAKRRRERVMTATDEATAARTATTRLAAELLAAHQRGIHVRTDRLFAGLLLLQWLIAIGVALWLSPRHGPESSVKHISMCSGGHIPGAAIVSLPVLLVIFRPGAAVTRHAVGAGQMSDRRAAHPSERRPNRNPFSCVRFAGVPGVLSRFARPRVGVGDRGNRSLRARAGCSGRNRSTAWRVERTRAGWNIPAGLYSSTSSSFGRVSRACAR